MATLMLRANRVKKYNSGESGLKQLRKCPMLLVTLGTAYIREKFGNDAKLVKKGQWIYDVSQFVKLYEEGV